MARATEQWLRAYQARGFHPKAVKALSDAEHDMKESDLHDSIIAYLRQHDIPYYHSRMDCATTGNVGAPDFFIFLEQGKTLHIECKSRIGKLSKDQLAYQAWLSKKQHPVFVVRTMEEFTAALESVRAASACKG